MKKSIESALPLFFIKSAPAVVAFLILTTSLLLFEADIYAQKANAFAGIDLNFAPRLEQQGAVERTIRQPDGKTIVIGRFNKINNVEKNNIFRLNADNTIDASFSLPANVMEGSLEILPDGKFIAFADIGEQTIVRLNSDLSVDSSFNFARAIWAPPGNTPKLKVRSDGKVFVFGQFKVKKSRLTIAENFIVLDRFGGIESGFNVNASGFIQDVIFLPNGKAALCGSFELTALGAPITRNFAVLNENGSLDSNFNTFFGNFDVTSGGFDRVWGVSVQTDGKLLVYGNFNGVYKQTGLRKTVSKNKGIVRLNTDGSFDRDFSVPFASAGFAQAIVQPDGKILVYGGTQLTAGVNYKFLNRLFSDGSLDVLFSENMPLTSAYSWGGTSEMKLLDDGRILVSGHFRVNNLTAVEKLVRLNADGTSDATFQTPAIIGGDPVGFYPLPDGKIFIYGNFGRIGSRTRIGLARLNASGSLDESFSFDTLSTDGVEVKTVTAQPDGKIIISGKFAVVNGEYLYTFANDYHSSVPTSNPVARLNQDGSLDNSFVTYGNAFDEIYAIALQSDGKVLIGGRTESPFQNYVVRLNPNGTVDTSFNRALFSLSTSETTILDIAVQPDGKIMVGGYFSHVAGFSRPKIARLNADGSLDESFSYDRLFYFSAIVRKITLQPDGKIIASGELEYNVNVPGLPRFNPNGTLDASFKWNQVQMPTITGDLQIQPDGKILFAGRIGYGSGENSYPYGLYRMNQNGEIEMQFDVQANKILLQSDGKIVFSGDEPQGQPPRLRRLFAGGGADDTFDFAFDDRFNKFIQQADGRILVAGRFSTVNGVRQAGLVRLIP